MKEISNPKERLDMYCHSAIAMNKKQGIDWAFGAVDFAYYAGMITEEQRDELFEKYRFLDVPEAIS